MGADPARNVSLGDFLNPALWRSPAWWCLELGGPGLARRGRAPAQPAEAPTPAGLLKDFIYYTRINRYDVASGYARQLFDMNLSPQQFVKVVEESGELSRFEQTLPRALWVPELEEAGPGC